MIVNRDEQSDKEETDISPEERALLDESIENNIDGDDVNMKRGQLDHTDEDGELLNEESEPDNTGEGLDVPGSEFDDENEAIGEEDEENNSYSLKDPD